ncbi:MAG: chemotaxis protein CheV [Opitutales bacterium]
MLAAAKNENQGILLTSGTNEVEFIEFYIGEECYGINVSKVQRVIARKSIKITPAVKAPEGVLGTIYIQDQAVMLLDLRTSLNLKGEASDPERQLILVTSFNQTVTAFMIDSVNKIHRTAWTEFDAVQNDFGGEAGYSTGTVRLEDRVVTILDLERLLLDYQPQRDENQAISHPERTQERGRVKIIYAEDSKMIRNVTTKTLAKAGYGQVVSFDNGRDCLDYLEHAWEECDTSGDSFKDFADIILTDIEMPKMDGLTLCKQIKENPHCRGKTPVVVYSSLISKEMASKCELVGADKWIAKPRGDEIIGVIDELVLKVADHGKGHKIVSG